MQSLVISVLPTGIITPSNKAFYFYFTNGRYIDYLSLTYATNKNRIFKLRYKYYIKQLSIYIYIFIYIGI
jgi:hypothetical protein